MSRESNKKPKEYNHSKIEKSWQKKWQQSGLYKVKEASKKAKCYVLDMFPYPSGEGLHVGHPKGFIATDVYARFKTMSGFNVLHPMGFDAFGLPAENYAIANKIHPRKSVEKNIKRYKEQLEMIGFNYDWSREIDTTDPAYYKWTQWIFLQMFKAGLAYESNEPINWCPSCKTGLANEDLEEGKCERCGSVVELKPIRQWVLKITDYADRLLKDLDSTNYKIPKVVDKTNPHKPGKPIVERKVAHAIVFDPKTEKYLIIRNKKHDWDTVIIGGIEDGEDAVEAARREVGEETGYTDIIFKRLLGGVTEAHYYAKHKGENRIAIAQGVYFELKSDKQIPRADGEDDDDEILWISKEDFVPGKMVNAELPIWLERINDEKNGFPKPLLDWPESIKESQKNWIGKSEGAEIVFKTDNPKIKDIKVFTTRPDTLFGVTFLAISPELAHRWIDDGIDLEADIEKYVKNILKDRVKKTFKDNPEKTGVFTGLFAINPANQTKVPIWVTNYVLGDVGTGAIMAVPAHDERDMEFAQKYELPILNVVNDSGKLINSGKFNKSDSDQAKTEITKFVGGKMTSTYKLRDWVFSRQRYWGEPIPLIHCDKCGVVPVPEKDLPVKLPDVKSYEPTGTGESPLASIDKWVNIKCPKCKAWGKRETNTMPQWAGSSWYYLRFMDVNNKKALVDSKKEKYWAPVDMYVGGSEHATRHLIYARFWHKFLYDIGSVSTSEPFARIGKNLGLILGADGRKMSKRWGNVINPDDVIKLYGADTLRVYEMFMGPFEQEIAWNTDSMIGSRRFVEKVWRLQNKINPKAKLDSKVEVLLNQTIKKVGEDIESFDFNTAVSALMILVNELDKSEVISTQTYLTLLRLVAPFAPHMTEELWSSLGGKKSIHTADWPAYDPKKLELNIAKVMIQINGKVRDMIEVPLNTDEKAILTMAKNQPNVKKWLVGEEVKKVIFVKNKLLNMVI